MGKYILIILLCCSPAWAADEYWEVKVHGATEAEAIAGIQAIHSAVNLTGATHMSGWWNPALGAVSFGVCGADLSAVKVSLRAAIQAEFGKLPEFDADREDPDEMDPTSRVVTPADDALGFNQKIAGYFGSDLRGVGAGAYTAWLDPGDSYCQTRTGFNCDGSTAAVATVNAALSTWDGMNQCNRWRIRLHHEGSRLPHATIAKLWVYWSTKIPWHRRADVKACLTPDEFEYIGETQTEACATLNARSAGLCAKFWP